MEFPPDAPLESRAYEEGIVARVWRFGCTVPGNDPMLWRKDEFGAWIQTANYGNRGSEFGWEIADFGCGNNGAGLARLRPVQWQNYLDRFSARTQSRMTADGLRNARKLL